VVDDRELAVVARLQLAGDAVEVRVAADAERLDVVSDAIRRGDLRDADAVGAVLDHEQTAVAGHARADRGLDAGGARTADQHGHVAVPLMHDARHALAHACEHVSEFALARADVRQGHRALDGLGRVRGTRVEQDHAAADVRALGLPGAHGVPPSDSSLSRRG
jgi:hypothetical protein